MRKLSKKEMDLIGIVKRAVRYENNGDNMRDVIEDYQVIDALRLLVKLVDKGEKE